MKTIHTFLTTLVFFALTIYTNAQSVGINSDGSSPNSSAMLDVSSTTKGLLIPRLTSAQMNAIVNPASGLMVFCTDCGAGSLGSMALYMNDAWNIVATNCLNPVSPVSGTHTAGSTQIVWSWGSGSGNAFRYKWNTTNDYASATDMGTSTTKTETSLICNTPYIRYVWAYNSCGASAPLTLTQSTAATSPSSFTEGTHVASGTQIVWNWIASAGATGYKWNTTNDFSSAVDMGNVLTKTETGLTVGNTYTRYVWAYSNCGETLVTLQKTLMYIGAAYGGGIVAYILQSGDPGYDANNIHGLITNTNNIGLSTWGCNDIEISGADGTAIGTGNQNTIDIIAGCSETGIPARLCADLSLNGFTDWYLPSKDELNKLYINKDAIGGLSNFYYFSSSECQYSKYMCWIQNFTNGVQQNHMKTNLFYTKPIRSF